MVAAFVQSTDLLWLTWRWKPIVLSDTDLKVLLEEWMRSTLYSLFGDLFHIKAGRTSTLVERGGDLGRSTGRGDGASRQQLRICMVAYSEYESDNRVRRYAETLAKRGDRVDVISIWSPHHSGVSPVVINGVTVYRIQCREHIERSRWSYASRTVRFMVVCCCYLIRLQRRSGFDVIHIHNMPDFLVFAAWYSKLNGARLILDIHDAVPELFASKFRTALKPVYVFILAAIEKLSSQFVDHVIVANHLWFDTITRRSVSPDRCSVIVNHVDPDLFIRRQRTRSDDKVIILFPGSLQWHQGVDIAIEAFAEVREKVPCAEFHIYSGGGGKEKELRLLVQSLGLENSVRFFPSVHIEEIVQVIANADLGVVPKRADAFGNEAYSTKIMEFMSQGVPVVAARTKIDTFYYEEGVVHFFEPGNHRAMANAIMDVIHDTKLRASLVLRGYDYVERNGWHCKKDEYLNLVDALASGRRSA